ncbi:unnamed protein product [Polarella glacialis]|uniref:Uncharacterized protein n=1 Tax=Polarella glacialis TaxID=89957 RepID=A0A813LAF1_POLGL|nr:unnamed protein product [Polarella glacialis]
MTTPFYFRHPLPIVSKNRASSSCRAQGFWQKPQAAAGAKAKAEEKVRGRIQVVRVPGPGLGSQASHRALRQPQPTSVSCPCLLATLKVSTAELEAIVFGGSALNSLGLSLRASCEMLACACGRQVYFEATSSLDADKADESEDESEEREERPRTKVTKDGEVEKTALDGPELKKHKRASKEDEAQFQATLEPASAWTDPDDAALEVQVAVGRQKRLQRNQETKVAGDEYSRRLREKFVKIHGSAKWADASAIVEDKDTSDSEAEDLPKAAATSARPLARSTGQNLKPGELDVARMKEIEMVRGQKKGPSAIEALQFHPSSELLLTGGRDKTLRLFAVDGDENPKVASYHFKGFPILSACFTPAGDQVLMTGLTSQMWGLDVKSGEPFEVRNISSEGRSAFRCLAMGFQLSIIKYALCTWSFDWGEDYGQDRPIADRHIRPEVIRDVSGLAPA